MKNINGKLVIGGVLGLSPCLVYANNTEKPVKPNIIIIYTDDMGVGDVSFLNDGWVKTPNIDRLASQGLVINNYYTSSPVSSASRAGLITGVFPTELGITCYLDTRQANANREQFDYLNPDIITMADIIKEAGYKTGHFGKWHLGGGRDVTNAPQITEYGFDEYSSTYESPDPDPLLTATNWIWSKKDSIKRWERTAYFVDKTLDFLRRHKGQPCFVNLWPDDMHDPWIPDKAAIDSENNTWVTPPNFKGVLAEYDKQIGRLLDGLTQLGLEENTIVIFTSDNGPAPSFDQQRTNQLHGIKCSLYEGGIRMPFIIKWPKRIKENNIDNKTVLNAVDLLPSLCALMGIKLPKNIYLSGEDMSKTLLGKSKLRKKDIMWDFGRNDYYNYPRGKNKDQRSPHLAIRRGNMKLLVNSWDENYELYDLSVDPKETTNIAVQHPALVKELHTELIKWWNKRKLPK